MDGKIDRNDNTLRYAQQPVLAVRRREQGPYDTVAVAVDFSEASQRAFHRARAFFPNAKFALVHGDVVSPDFGGRNAEKSMDAVEAEEKARVVRLAEQDMADHFGAVRGKAGLDVALEQGDAEAVMTAYVEKHWPDLWSPAPMAEALFSRE